MFFLDSDVCINLMRGKMPTTYDRMQQCSPELFGVPIIAEAELRTGAEKSDDPSGNLLLLERFLTPFASIPFDRECAIAYGQIRKELERKGQKIGPNDMLIAATTLAHGATLLTGNAREFNRVDGLRFETWEEVELV